jgi:hypothetical protein
MKLSSQACEDLQFNSKPKENVVEKKQYKSSH